jgi:hypothetical protein
MIDPSNTQVDLLDRQPTLRVMPMPADVNANVMCLVAGSWRRPTLPVRQRPCTVLVAV